MKLNFIIMDKKITQRGFPEIDYMSETEKLLQEIDYMVFCNKRYFLSTSSIKVPTHFPKFFSIKDMKGKLVI